MTSTITVASRFPCDTPIKGYLIISEDKKLYKIRKIINSTTLEFTPWTWVKEIISWNPCNTDELIDGNFN